MGQSGASRYKPAESSAGGEVRGRTRRVIRAILLVAGCATFVLGAALFLGNRTGEFPTFPFAGFIVLLFGSILVGMAECL